MDLHHRTGKENYGDVAILLDQSYAPVQVIIGDQAASYKKKIYPRPDGCFTNADDLILLVFVRIDKDSKEFFPRIRDGVINVHFLPSVLQK